MRVQDPAWFSTMDSVRWVCMVYSLHMSPSVVVDVDDFSFVFSSLEGRVLV